MYKYSYLIENDDLELGFTFEVKYKTSDDKEVLAIEVIEERLTSILDIDGRELINSFSTEKVESFASRYCKDWDNLEPELMEDYFKQTKAENYDDIYTF